MAKYEREFLVPYIQNICALEITGKKIDGIISSLSYKIHQLKAGKMPKEPKKMAYEIESLNNAMLRLGGGALLVCGIIMVLSGVNFVQGFGWFFTIVGAITFGITTHVSKKVDSHNAWIDEQYAFAYDRYKRNCIRAKKEGEEESAPMQQELEMWKRERTRVGELLQKVYRVNVIPGQYRNLYAAVYLNDYFSNSREDDLAMALNTFVLEQIKEKLDIIIEQNAQIILNQHVIMSNQRLAMEQQENHNAMIEAKLDRIADSNEERNQYLSMIESNTEAMAYFAAAEYIRKI